MKRTLPQSRRWHSDNMVAIPETTQNPSRHGIDGTVDKAHAAVAQMVVPVKVCYDTSYGAQGILAGTGSCILPNHYPFVASYFEEGSCHNATTSPPLGAILGGSWDLVSL